MPELEIVNGPLTLWWAPVGETFPLITVAPAGNFVLIGTSGAHNYSEDGVTVSNEKTVDIFRALASPYPRKTFISEADVMVTIMMADLTLEQLRLAFNNNVVTVGGDNDSIEMDVGLDVTEFALLVRGTGKSPQFIGGNLQYELPRVVEENSQEYAFVKGEPAMAELVFRVVYDEGNSNPAGRIVVQTS